MNEKQKAHKQFETLIQKTIFSATTSLNRKVSKAMNAVSDDGTAYETEREIQDAYGCNYITDAERRRLLKALEYKDKRPKIKEDHILSLCRKALKLISDDNYADKQDQKARDKRNAEYDIKRRGNLPLECGCCGNVIVGEYDSGIGRIEYPNYRTCIIGRVCDKCLKFCNNQCKESTI